MCCRLSCGSCYMMKFQLDCVKFCSLDCVLCRRFLWNMLYIVDLSGLCYVL